MERVEKFLKEAERYWLHKRKRNGYYPATCKRFYCKETSTGDLYGLKIAGNLNWFPAVWHMKKFIENSVDSVKFLAYNDIEAESLLRNLRSVMHNTKGGMPTWIQK